MSRILSLFVLALLVGLGSCKKDEIDLASLNTNPFDADYVGTPIFTFVSATTTSGVVNGVPVNILNVDVQVHTELQRERHVPRLVPGLRELRDPGARGARACTMD
jgi:hypothetical protein